MDMEADRKTAASELAFRRFWQGLGWFGVGVVTVLTLMPSPPEVPEVLGWDKGQHLIAYAGLMWWFRQSFAPRALWIVFLIALGVSLECIQGLTGYRLFEYGDMVANSLGVVCGVGLAATPLGRMVPWLDRRIRTLV